MLQALLRFLVCNHPVRARGISVTADQQAAGAVMKVLGGAYLWALIGIRFFRWSAAQRRLDEQDRRARFAAEQLTTPTWRPPWPRPAPRPSNLDPRPAARLRGQLLGVEGRVRPARAGWHAATLSGVGSEAPSGLALSRVRLACGRIISGAQAIVQAHRLQAASEGTFEPWTEEYHREAVHIYSMSLPRSYQRDIGALFRDSLETMAAMSIPAKLAEDWIIVGQYLTQASLSIERLLASGELKPAPKVKISASEMEDHTPPGVIRFELLAALTTSEAAERLKRAALAVQRHVNVQTLESLSDKELHLLDMAASGVKIAEMKAELCCSERTLYRELAKLWKTLGVPDRDKGLRKAASEGLID